MSTRRIPQVLFPLKLCLAQSAVFLAVWLRSLIIWKMGVSWSQKRVLATDDIAYPPKHDRAKRSDSKASAVHREARQQ
jgi:hypothetical protein